MTFLSSRDIYDIYRFIDLPVNKGCNRFEDIWCTIYFVEPFVESNVRGTFLSAAYAQSEVKQRPVLELKDFLKLVCFSHRRVKRFTNQRNTRGDKKGNDSETLVIPPNIPFLSERCVVVGPSLGRLLHY